MASLCLTQPAHVQRNPHFPFLQVGQVKLVHQLYVHAVAETSDPPPVLSLGRRLNMGGGAVHTKPYLIKLLLPLAAWDARRTRCALHIMELSVNFVLEPSSNYRSHENGIVY
jgi:hypothetical protein